MGINKFPSINLKSLKLNRNFSSSINTYLDEFSLAPKHFKLLKYTDNSFQKNLKLDSTAIDLVLKDSNIRNLKTDKSSCFLWGLTSKLDFSSIESNGEKLMGYGFGLSTQYIIKNKFLIGFGLSYNKKNYIDKDNNYSPPKGFWTGFNLSPNQPGSPIKPDKTTAICDILEVPLELGYHIKLNKKNSLMISSGLSSYIMLKEKYTFNFSGSAYSPPTQEIWKTKNVSYNWLSVANFSIAYQRKINENNLLEIAPYYQIPLKGIGFGKVNLHSMGVGLNYKFK